MTAGGSDAIDGDIPDLPRDPSAHATPLPSGGESSRETTPLMARKLSPRKKRQMNPDRYLTFTKTPSPVKVNQNHGGTKVDDTSDTSGYRSQDTLSSRDHRVMDADR